MKAPIEAKSSAARWRRLSRWSRTRTPVTTVKYPLEDRYPLSVEYSSAKKPSSNKPLFERKGYSIPEGALQASTSRTELNGKRFDLMDTIIRGALGKPKINGKSTGLEV